MTRILMGLCLLLLPLASSFAVKVTSLYHSEAMVAAQTDDLKEQAIRDGFLEILIKLSGNPQIAHNPVIKVNLNRADYFVQQIEYAPSTPMSSEYALRIGYSAPDVNRLLKKAGVNYWGEDRPLILVWVAAADRKGADIISNETQNAIFTALYQQGKRYGLPLIFPTMDVADVSQISVDTVMAMDVPNLKEAGKRYAPDILLIGKLVQGARGYESEWELILDQTELRWQINAKTPEEAIENLMHLVSQTLSHQSVAQSVHTIPRQWLKLEVMNVTERKDLTQLLQYIKKLPAVDKVELGQISSDVVDLTVLIQGSVAGFIQNASNGKRLVLKFQDPTERKLVYVWAD